MANISKAIRVFHTATQAEADAFAAVIPVLWDYPFNDTNYVINVSIEIQGAANAVYVSVTDVTPTGFTASTLAGYTAGDIVVVHAIASHV